MVSAARPPATFAAVTAQDSAAAGRRSMGPLWAAGFTTAFGAHAVAANLGGFSDDAVRSLLTLGLLLALYDGAEVLLKPLFGWVADRVGARPVLLAGLAGFAVASAAYAVVDSPGWLWVARFGQGAAASAFSPAASALVARLNPAAKHGRAFGSYGFAKSLGYTLGPLLGGGLVWAGGLRLLFAVTAAVVQPRAGRAQDAGRLGTRTGLTVGLLLAAAGLVSALLAGLAGVLVAAVLIGTGTGLITPLGFAALAASTPQERLGQTMGTAELGRELGDAGGPLLVAGVATAASLGYGYTALAVLLAVGPVAGLVGASLRTRR